MTTADWICAGVAVLLAVGGVVSVLLLALPRDDWGDE
jgi:hypothetical protein